MSKRECLVMGSDILFKRDLVTRMGDQEMRLGVPFEVEYLGDNAWRVAFDIQYPEWVVWLGVGNPDEHDWCNVMATVTPTDPDADGLDEIRSSLVSVGVVGGMDDKNVGLVNNTVKYDEKISPGSGTYADALAFYLGQAILTFLQSKK